MALPATEDFTGAAGALAGSWTQARPTDGTVNKDGAGAGQASANGDVLAWWNADTFNADQYAQHNVTSCISGATGSASVRCAGTTNATSNGYIYQTIDGLFKLVNGTFTSIGADPVSAWSNGDTQRLEVSGTGGAMALVMKRNGVQVGSNVNDTALTSGSAGAHMFGASTNRIDNWQGDNLTAAVAAMFSAGTRRATGQRGPFDARGFLLSPYNRYDFAASVALASTTFIYRMRDLDGLSGQGATMKNSLE